MTRLRQDVAYALRTFIKAPGFAAIAIIVLGVGIGANTAIFSIVNELLLRPLSGRVDELYGLYSQDRTAPDTYRAFSYANYADIRDQNELFEGLMAHTFAMVGVPAGEDTRQAFAAVISSNYFDTLGVRLAAGRPFSAAEERPGSRIRVVIATYGQWKMENLDPGFIGSTIRINAEDYTVVGVTPEGFTGTMALASANLYLPLGMYDTVVNERFKTTKTGLGDRANPALIVAGRLKPGVTEASAAARLEALSHQLEAAYPAENKNQSLTVNKLPRVGTSTSPSSNAPIATLTALLLGLSGVVLIIACLNIANMLLARGSARRKELALRLALGAGRGRIVRQLLTESMLLAIAGATLGLLMSFWATRALGQSIAGAMPLTITFNSRPDANVLLATLAFAMMSTVAFGLGPALRLSRRDLVADLKDRANDGASTGRRFGARNLMVIGQVALSLAMLTAAGIFARTAITASLGDPGHSYDGLMRASLDVALAGFDEGRGRTAYAALVNRVRSTPGVTAVSMASTLPFGDTQIGGTMERVGSPTQEPVRARTYRIIGADYFTTLGLRMVRGREFSRAEEEDRGAPRVAIVDEAFARRMFPNEDPLGQLIRVAPRPGAPESTRGEPMQIVGIAPPIREELLDRAPASHVYVPFGRHFESGVHLLVRTTGANEAAAVEALRSAIRATDPRFPVLGLSTLQAFHDSGIELWALKTGAGLFTSLGVLAMLLAVVGVYGVKSYIVALRTREIGIRMALGASGRDVLRLMLRDGIFLTGTGIAIGLPLAVLVSIAFTKVFVEIGGFDATVISIATVVLAAAATVASVVPARRATRVQPLQALQAD
jgi:predicted permease